MVKYWDEFTSGGDGSKVLKELGDGIKEDDEESAGNSKKEGEAAADGEGEAAKEEESDAAAEGEDAEPKEEEGDAAAEAGGDDDLKAEIADKEEGKTVAETVIAKLKSR